jgi:type IV secretion system protein VirD4
MLFLGGKESASLKEISDLLGKETIDLDKTYENRGREKSHGISHQKMGKDLMTQDELAVLDNSKCILQLRGERPFLSDKYDITKHPFYRYHSDVNPNFEYEIQAGNHTELIISNNTQSHTFDLGQVKE